MALLPWMKTMRESVEIIQKKDPRFHVEKIGCFVKLPLSGDIITATNIRSLICEGNILVVKEDNGDEHSILCDDATEACIIRDNIAHDLDLIRKPVWVS